MSTEKLVEGPQTGDASMVFPSFQVYIWRGLFALTCVFIGFLDTFRYMAHSLRVGAGNYSTLVILMAIVLFVGLDRKRARALNIHDREVDYIIGGMAVIIALTVKGQLLPRFEEWGPLLRLDLLTALIFAFGVSGLVYGMRSTLHFGPGWILLFSYNSAIHLMISVGLGGGFWGPAMANVIGLSLALMVASNRDVVQSIYFGLMNFVFGCALVFTFWLLTDGSKYFTLVPAIVATISVVFLSSRGQLWQWRIRRRMPTVEKVLPAALVSVLATGILVYLPTPSFERLSETVQAGPGLPSGIGVSAPLGWDIEGAQSFDWAGRYFGPDSSLLRQTLNARYVNEAWDKDGLKRTVVVDTLRATQPFQALAFGDEALYSTLSGRKSDVQQIDLGYGITAHAYTVLDETIFLTYTKLVFEWQRENDVVEKITVIAVDDHREEAIFPELAPSATQMFIQIATILLRGNMATTNNNTEIKDLDLVQQVGRQIVREEMSRAQ